VSGSNIFTAINWK